MSVTSPPTIDALPTAPSTSNPSTFSALADAFIAALATFRTQINALGSNVYGNATDAASSASSAANQVTLAAAQVTLAAAQASASAASAAQSAAAANVVKWVSGTTYSEGAGVWSPINYQSYRRKVAGAGTTDPSLDAANWALIGASTQWAIKTAAYTALAGDAIQANTTGGAFTLTLPASPAANDLVRIADYAGTFATNNLTIGRNGSKIMGLAEDMTISTNNISITLQYIDATQGWRIV